MRNHAREALWAPGYGEPGRVDEQEVLRFEGLLTGYCARALSFKKLELSKDVVAQASACHLSVCLHFFFSPLPSLKEADCYGSLSGSSQPYIAEKRGWGRERGSTGVFLCKEQWSRCWKRTAEGSEPLRRYVLSGGFQ